MRQVTSPVAENNVAPAERSLPELLARTLRHEVGDFLQKVYASVAILQKRLPPDWDQERDVLKRLRTGAEACRDLLDALQDFLCPVSLSCATVDLARVADQLVEKARDRHPNLEISAEASGPAAVMADGGRAAQVGSLLLTNACEAARRRVIFCTSAYGPAGTVEWTIADDGPGVSAEMTDRLFNPFFTTRAGHAGLGLPLARKLVLLHGGTISVGNRPEGGFFSRVVLPCEPPGEKA